MSLLDQAKADIEAITGNTDEFGVTLQFFAPTGQTVIIAGYSTDHTNHFDQDGNPINGKVTTVSFSEKFLTDLDYPTRNTQQLVTFLNHRVIVTYSDGTAIKYAIDQWKPDYMINLITLFLSSYNGAD